MSKKESPIGDPIRRAVNESDMSRYRICQICRIDQGGFHRFMSGKGGMTLANLEAVAELLGLRVVADEKPDTNNNTKTDAADNKTSTNRKAR